ncbi:fibrobacter succinogenes major paralogous domain-containing protein [Chryseobacterium potabilaquae]|uniref:Uncharacterized protein n=1 Tax=Chryseobacterium potabilaquae TaxID=2675057 RepID=A0A6N4X2I5_9FLAO|nr:FISUMP domain-containing protein [Chryseobacterium potabilaquae]CAA7194060.1 hypothetical protein CHRY9293_00440 [Chryseobacterium potabilaquae]
MKKRKLLPLVFIGIMTSGQVGINTPSPKATVDIVAKNTDGSLPEGILVPKLTGDVLFTASTLGTYGSNQNGVIVFVTQPASNANQIGQTVQIDEVGFYYFDAGQNRWKKLGSSSNIYNSDGTLSSTRHVIMDGNNLGFTGGRIGMGTSSPDPSAILDLTSTTLGLLPPRMTKVQMDAIQNPLYGLVVFCTDCFGANKGCLMINDSVAPTTPNWGSLCSTNVATGIIDDLQCANATTSGALHSGIIVSGVTTTIPYSGGHNGTHFAGNFNSTGVTGLVAHINDGFISDGNGSLVFEITGIPSGAGTASFNITVGEKTCTFTVDVDDFTASVTSIDCGNGVFSPASIIQGQSYTGTLTIPYTGGNGDSYPQQQFSQNGLTFTLPAGTLATGNGNFIYTISGIPTSALTMSIPISFGNVSCNVSTVVTTAGGGSVVTMCMGNNTTKVWMAHNLGADTSLDPDIPIKQIHGNYYQWGSSTIVADADTPAGAISGWDAAFYAPDLSWNGSGNENAPMKTANDPCPSGFRVPTRNEWGALRNNSTVSKTGSFTNSASNFGSALIYTCGNNKITLPATGGRSINNGSLENRGLGGGYSSSTAIDNTNAYGHNFNLLSGEIFPARSDKKTNGQPVRCIQE